MLQISQLFIYPIKSLGGIAIESAVLTDRGFEFDRRWMLVDAGGRFLSQREIPVMALLSTELTIDGLLVKHRKTGAQSLIPFKPLKDEKIEVSIWDDNCLAQLVSEEADQWFSAILGLSCRLVYMPTSSERKVDTKYVSNGALNSFSDGYPLLIIGQASLDELNSRLDIALPINRFRPNIVFTGGQPYEEDRFHTFKINGTIFNGVKLCARCNVITIDQQSATLGKEPLKILSKYRFKNNKILFGQNLIYKGIGTVSVGDKIEVIEYHTEERFIVAV